ncbi:MAG: glycoside hydrolase family 3 protein, partial [Parasporobacterium sp.]|nr:glycoside hydrolase family 3 protein [Parasporobacterium sp.]
AFEIAVKEGGARGVMCAYNAINGVACSENKKILTDILRNEWGFKGMTVTDWGAIKDRVIGLKAGINLEMPGTPGRQDEKVAAAVRSGELSEAELDESITHVLELVQTWQERYEPGTVIDRKEMSVFSGKIAEQCAVLLKNDGILPLNRKDNVVFMGEFAADTRYQGRGSSHINTEKVYPATEAAPDIPFVQGYLGMDTDPALLAEAIEAAKKAAAVVIFAGQPDNLETEGRDRSTMELPESQNTLIAEVLKVNPNVVVVLHGGSPMVFPWIDDVKAILQMYLGGERAGEASVRLIFGEANPSGKLAESWPLRIEDTPAFLNYPSWSPYADYNEGVFIGYRYYDSKKAAVEFPFGHG